MPRRAHWIVAALAGLPPAAALAQTNPPAAVPAAAPATPQAVHPGTDPAVAALLDQANYWRLQNRPELVLRTLERVLAVDPRNAEALSGAAQSQAQLGNRQAAEGYLTRLKQLAPNDPRLSETDITVRAATVDQSALNEARRLAQAGRAAEAAQRYRELFRGAAPPDAYAQEYYATLAGTEGGFAEARDGLSRLAARAPNDMRLQLAYAQVLTYRDTTRTDGIARLRQLAANPEVSNTATAAWRQALLWQGPSPEMVPQLQSFLERFPNDTAVQQKLAEAQNPPVGAPDETSLSRIRGFEQLNAGKLRDAQREFELAVSRNPEDADATGGLGLVRLREGRVGEARTLLERAIRLAPEKRDQWQRALDGASYATDLATARNQLQAGNLDAAEQALRRATARETGDRADADALLGDLALRRGDFAGAETRYRAALSRRPNFGAAASGLYEVLQQQGRFAEAEEMQRRAGGPLTAGTANATRANALRTEAQRASDTATAIAMLREAQGLDPASPWIRLDLARLLARQGRIAEARQVAEEPASSGNPDALYAAALFADDDNRPAEAAGYINRIPVRLRNADMNRLLARTRVAEEAQRAATLWRSGQQQQARSLLLALAARPDPTGANGQAAVRGFGQLNDTSGAMQAAQAALAANPRATATARLGIAGALLGAGAEQEAIRLARTIEAQPNLSSEERRQAASLQSGLAIRVSDRLNEQGDQAGAYDALAPVLARDPTNTAANLALARLYQGANQPQQAGQIAEGVLRADPQSLDARFAAVDAAIAARDWSRAEALLVEARALSPDEPRVPLLEAKLARASGNTGRALRALEMAAAQRRAQLGSRPGGDPMTGGAAMVAEGGSDNPFRRQARPLTPMATTGTDPLTSEIQRELLAVRDEAAARIQGGIGYRTRSGTAGRDRLEEVSAPVEASIGSGVLGGRVTATMTPVSIDAGKMGGNNIDDLRSYGTNAVAGSLQGTNASPSAAERSRLVARDTQASGVALGLGYSQEGFRADVGTSPIGFRQQNLLGGVEWAPALSSTVRLRLTAEQRSVTDSVLSWSGVRDPNSGRSWGGVVRTGGRAQLEYGSGPVGLYAGAGYSVFNGQNTASNSRFEAGAGASYMVWKRPEDELQTGLDLVYFGYDKNQRLYTYGNGGYFSPQSYFAANIPVDYRGRSGDLAYRIGGTIGYQSYKEDAARYFPTDAGLQAQLESSLGADPTARASQPARSGSGIIGGVRGDIEYSVTPNLRIGALLRYDRTANWNEARGLFFARYRFDQ
ncbi:BCSC C-terminal domain-containing protein [Belnapia sp. T6]|uniref:BCSC C-terminal domain-containing protein n=1 Tax=Belnapia mucosa TaxID=2804532 RepID=A0ABS1UZW6_9PROT|nr:cellulose biosynthesis protein BcsC [Belnapia mucosa]MBL6454955.1 BCSC C-terminal domain-containing protein [Belnapia mucosa]